MDEKYSPEDFAAKLKLWYLVAIGCVLLLDQATKYWATVALRGGAQLVGGRAREAAGEGPGQGIAGAGLELGEEGPQAAQAARRARGERREREDARAGPAVEQRDRPR